MQALFEIHRHSGVMNGFVCLAYENIDVEEPLHWLACQAVVFGAPGEKYNYSPPSLRYGVAAIAFALRSKAKAGPARIRTWDQGIMSPLL